MRAWQDDRPDTNMRGLTYCYGASEEHPGRKMHVVADHTIMLDNGGCVHNAILSDLSTRIDDGIGHDDGSGLNSGRVRNHRTWVDESHRQQTMVEGSLEACGPHFVIANGHQILTATFAVQQLQVPTSSEDLAAAEFTARFLASIIDEGNSLESSHCPRDVEDHLAVPARAP